MGEVTAGSRLMMATGRSRAVRNCEKMREMNVSMDQLPLNKGEMVETEWTLPDGYHGNRLICLLPVDR